MKILILVLFPILSFSQQQGKLVRNQSLKLEATTIDDTLWILECTNMNSCTSTIDVNVGGLILSDSTTLKQFETLLIALEAPFEIKVRNAVVCTNGTTAWLTMTSTRDADKLIISKLQQSRSYESNCDIPTFKLPTKITKPPDTSNPPNDNNTRTKSL